MYPLCKTNAQINIFKHVTFHLQIIADMEASNFSSSQDGEEPEISNYLEIPYKILLECIFNSNLKLASPLLQEILCSFICQNIEVEQKNLPKTALKLLGLKVKKFLSTIRGKKGSRSRHIERVHEEPWAKGILLLPKDTFLSHLRSQKKKPKPLTGGKSEKKKVKNFNTLSTRGKFLTAKRLREGYDPEAIELAAGQTLTKAGKKDARFVFKKINSSTGLTAARVRKSIEESEKIPLTKMTAEEGLGFLLRQNLTKAQYQAIRYQSKEKGADIWPPYHQIQEAKANCRPEEIEVSDHSALVPLQELLHHTIKRILVSEPAVEQEMVRLAEENDNQLSAELIFKLGFDGSGSHHRHMQADQAGDHPTVKSLVSTQMVPLLIQTDLERSGFPLRKKLWISPFPNHPHACRPVRLSFEVENLETTCAEFERLTTEIKNLEDYKVSLYPSITLSFRAIFSMIDGKVASNLTNKNTTKCAVCDASGQEMAVNEGPFNPVNDERLKFGASPLHFLLRTFELILHIAYKQVK